MSKIVKNPKYFQEDFPLDKIIGRKEKIKEIRQRIMPSSFIHLHVFGESGTGKTSTVKEILKKYPNSLYVNCWNKPSKHSILEEILRELGIGVAPKQATNDLVRIFHNTKKKIICLDEIEKLKEKDILVTLAQHCECLILISNDRYCLDNLDYKSKGKLSTEEIEFKKNSDQEVKQILINRASKGLYANTINNSLLSTIAELSNGNIRVAIQTLAIASRYTEWNENRTISINEINRAIKSTGKQNTSNTLKLLNVEQKILYNIIKENESIPTRELFEKYKSYSGNPVKDSCYRKYMRQMVNLELVKEQSSGRWKEYAI